MTIRVPMPIIIALAALILIGGGIAIGVVVSGSSEETDSRTATEMTDRPCIARGLGEGGGPEEALLVELRGVDCSEAVEISRAYIVDFDPPFPWQCFLAHGVTDRLFSCTAGDPELDYGDQTQAFIAIPVRDQRRAKEPPDEPQGKTPQPVQLKRCTRPGVGISVDPETPGYRDVRVLGADCDFAKRVAQAWTDDYQESCIDGCTKIVENIRCEWPGPEEEVICLAARNEVRFFPFFFDI